MKTNAKFADVILVRGDVDYQILMLQRNDDNDFMPGKWGLPGGHVDKTNIIESTDNFIDIYNLEFTLQTNSEVYILSYNQETLEKEYKLNTNVS